MKWNNTTIIGRKTLNRIINTTTLLGALICLALSAKFLIGWLASDFDMSTIDAYAAVVLAWVGLYLVLDEHLTGIGSKSRNPLIKEIREETLENITPEQLHRAIEKYLARRKV